MSEMSQKDALTIFERPLMWYGERLSWLPQFLFVVLGGYSKNFLHKFVTILVTLGLSILSFLILKVLF
jgi:hypothetical protein